MTGFGKGSVVIENKTYSVEIRSLNSKQLDLNLRIPADLKSREQDIRKLIAKHLHRGKIDFSMFLESSNKQSSPKINVDLVKSYLSEIEKVMLDKGLSIDQTIMQEVLKMPDVWVSNQEELQDEDWAKGLAEIETCITSLVEFRKDEGKALEQDLIANIHTIENLLAKVDIPEKERVERVKERIRKSLSEVVEQDKIDDNRFEQELIYYIEKYDISEEKTRLRTHCSYFKETLNQSIPVGKKLNFIAQEIGREINTLGSKANDAKLQNIVVQMKDSLEKIKEQSFNVL